MRWHDFVGQETGRIVWSDLEGASGAYVIIHHAGYAPRISGRDYPSLPTLEEAKVFVEAIVAMEGNG